MGDMLTFFGGISTQKILPYGTVRVKIPLYLIPVETYVGKKETLQ